MFRGMWEGVKKVWRHNPKSDEDVGGGERGVEGASEAGQPKTTDSVMTVSILTDKILLLM